ncbi:MAG: 50S ribosomal protein L18 [Bacteroidetes bacterium]|nr:50S ribosomal protein L18 [Bacteroidota bacterium]
MLKKNPKILRRQKVKLRIRKKIQGTNKIPRLAIYKSNQRIYASLIDDVSKNVITSVSSISLDKKSKNINIEKSKQTGELIADKAKEKGISKVVFDRSYYIYHGKVKALAEGARSKGLIF